MKTFKQNHYMLKLVVSFVLAMLNDRGIVVSFGKILFFLQVKFGFNF